MRDESRLWRKPLQRANILQVRERIGNARKRMEEAVSVIGFPQDPGPVDVLNLCCSALETALLVHFSDIEAAQEIIAECLILLQAERNLRGEG